MRRFIPLAAMLLATTGCGREERKSNEDLATYDVQEAPPAVESAPGEPPAVGPTAAPGVAFNYRYAFRLPGTRISAVQEQHAAACEKLGLDRCRITGMRYRLVGEDDVEAMLAFKLDPAIARQFGKTGIEAVTRAEGMLVDSEISGEDAGADIAAANRSDVGLREELARVEAQLARPGLGAGERTDLRAQAERLRESLRANSATRTERQEALAKTPLVFEYGSGSVAPGFDTRSSLDYALERSGENFMAGISAMLIILVTVAPWALLALLFYWLYRRFARPLIRRTGSETETV